MLELAIALELPLEHVEALDEAQLATVLDVLEERARARG